MLGLVSMESAQPHFLTNAANISVFSVGLCLPLLFADKEMAVANVFPETAIVS